jgi:hypothetical protein
MWCTTTEVQHQIEFLRIIIVGGSILAGLFFSGAVLCAALGIKSKAMKDQELFDKFRQDRP